MYIKVNASGTIRYIAETDMEQLETMRKLGDYEVEADEDGNAIRYSDEDMAKRFRSAMPKVEDILRVQPKKKAK